MLNTRYVKVDIPEGYELACERMRPVKRGEFYLSGDGLAHYMDDEPDGEVRAVVIVRQIEKSKQILRMVNVSLPKKELTFETVNGRFHVNGVLSVEIPASALECHPVPENDPATDDWDWPWWVKSKWIAMNEDLQWFAYDAKPSCDGQVSTWQSPTGKYYFLPTIEYKDTYGFVPPPCTDWRKSLRKNPNWKEAT